MVIDPPRRSSRADRGEGHKLAAGEDVVVDHVFLEIVDQASNFGPNHASKWPNRTLNLENAAEQKVHRQKNCVEFTFLDNDEDATRRL